MLRLTVNERPVECAEGSTLMAAARAAGVELPALCDDYRLAPVGACRLCMVQVKGWARPVTACNTPAGDGMEIETHTLDIERSRLTNLRLLARRYPAEPFRRFPDKPFHRLVREYGLESDLQGTADPDLTDDSHPYVRVDMSQCVYCLRCVRICEDVQGQFVWRLWERGHQTRILPDSGTTLLQSSCVSCGACTDTCPTGALEDVCTLIHGDATGWTRTTCPYCGTGCEMNVGSRAGRVVAVRPVPDAPVSKGHLCVKGRYAFDFNIAADRVVAPMLRNSAGDWKPVSWDEAIAFAADAFRRIVARDGPDAVGVLGSARATNEENYLTQKFARVVLGTNNVDCCARVCHAPTAQGMKEVFGTGAATNCFDDIEHAATILVCGANVTENHPIVGARIKQAVRRGAKLIVIDPRRIELAAMADVHLAPRPGTNVPLLNAMAWTILHDRLYDAAFVEDRVKGLDEFGGSLGSFKPDDVAVICGVDPDSIRAAARLYATHKPAMCFHGLGVTEHVQGTDGVVCLANLALMTGNVGKRGCGVNPLRGQNNVQGAAHMGCEPQSLTGAAGLDRYGSTFQGIWGKPLSPRPGLNLMQMIDAAAGGRMKGLWAIGYDISLTNPNAIATQHALTSMELVIVQDLFMNQTARYAHVFFPAASAFEKDGTFMNAERRVQRVRKAVEPPGAARPDWQIIGDLARAMGFGEQFAFASPEGVWDEVRQVWPAGRGISYQRLEAGGLQWPCPSEDHPGTEVLHADTFPTGQRASLCPVAYAPTEETPSQEFPLLLTTGRTLYQFNAGTMTMRTPNAELRPRDVLAVSPADAERLGIGHGGTVRVTSRWGQTELPAAIDAAMKPGELFATFHSTDANVNQLTSGHRDARVDTPEYKVTAVRVQPLPARSTA